MSLRCPILVFLVVGACDTFAERTQPEPLPPDLAAACPESARFERSGSNECTEIGCSTGFVLNLSPSSGWAPGAYRFELKVDARPVNCQGSLPLKACGEASFSCDAAGVRLLESGCALPPDQHGIAGLTFDGFPLAVSVRVLKDGAELTSAELDAAYTVGQPNGPGCEPICCSASGELVLSARASSVSSSELRLTVRSAASFGAVSVARWWRSTTPPSAASHIVLRRRKLQARAILSEERVATLGFSRDCGEPACAHLQTPPCGGASEMPLCSDREHRTRAAAGGSALFAVGRPRYLPRRRKLMLL